MSEFVYFLKEYKEVLVSGFCLILTIICIIVKRRPKTFDDFLMIVDEALLQAPTLINLAECPGNGLAKKKEVISSIFSIVSRKLGRSLSDSEKSYLYSQSDYSVEAILSTPQKKGE